MSKKYSDEISQVAFERIERFLLGRMDEGEQAQFESDLKQDEQLRNEVELQRKLFAAVESGSVNLDEIPQSRPTLRWYSRMSRYGWHAVAASVVLAVGIWHFGFRQSPEERLFATYFVAPKGLVTPMSATGDYAFHDAMVDYKQGDYRQAIAKWDPLLAQAPKNDTLNFFVGVAYLAQGDANRSTPYLQQAASHAESVFIDEAWFYLGMAQLKQGNTAQAKASLGKSRMERSKALLGQLKTNSP